MKFYGARQGGGVRVPLWFKLAFFGAVGVAVTHSLHVAIGTRISTRALARQEADLGQAMARLIGEHGVGVVLVEDEYELDELCSDAVDSERLLYCFIEKDGLILASSFDDSLPYDRPPAQVVALRRLRDDSTEPLVVVVGGRKILDVAHPMLGGDAGVVRLGMRLDTLQATRRRVASSLGILAVLIMLLAFGAAFVVSRRIVRPLQEILAVAEQFDPATEPSPVSHSSRDEVGELTDKFNEMTAQLHRAHVERERARQTQVQTERLAALGSLVAGVAHEINNPLTGLKNCQRRLSKPDLPEASRQGYLDIMEEGLSRIESVVSQLLDFGQSSALHKQRTEVSEIVRVGSGLILPLLKQQQVSLVLDMGSLGDRTVFADRRRIAQALLNLLLNAAYVTSPGKQIRLRVHTRDSALGISVEDEGPGIPEEVRPRILDPFFTTKPEGKGTGLGLSVTQTIVEAHGGKLAFEFPEQGTIVTIWLPLVDGGKQS